jgi:4-amino-4-deoxy-L-arabinose transferase-like glycosyltransferase
MYGLLGASIAFISKKARTRKSSIIITILIGIILAFATGGLIFFFGFIPLYIGVGLVIAGIIMGIIETKGIIRAIAMIAVVIVILLTFTIPKWTPFFHGLPSWLNLPLLASPLIISLLILARIVLQTLDRLESPTWRPFLIAIILGINAIVLWIILRVVVIVLWYV